MFLVMLFLFTAKSAVAQSAEDKNQLVPPKKADAFSFYTTREMLVLARSHLAVLEQGDKVPADVMAKGAEFRGYLLGKAEAFHPDWRNKCDVNEPEQPDRYVQQVAQVIASVKPEELNDLDAARVDVLVGWGVLGRCVGTLKFK
jgi:hypothetical protein